MTTHTQAPIRPGDRVRARTAFGQDVDRFAVTGPYMSDFLVVRVCRPDEWFQAEVEGRSPVSVPWPAEDVRPAGD